MNVVAAFIVNESLVDVPNTVLPVTFKDAKVAVPVIFVAPVIFTIFKFVVPLTVKFVKERFAIVAVPVTDKSFVVILFDTDKFVKLKLDKVNVPFIFTF